jgi:uncharacterized protein YgiM (DUF1202 family)
MRGNLPAASLCVLLLSLTATVSYTHTASAEGNTTEESVQTSWQEPTSTQAIDSISNLLPTLEVKIDPCYVFIKPTSTSRYFGPLSKGEKIKWLDAEGDWTRVWIPRLRISGWVKKAQVKEINEPDSSKVRVPEDVLCKVSVVASRANIREDATSQSRVIFVANKDEEFWLLNEEKGWYQVWLPGQKTKGWVFGGIVEKRSPE